MLFHIFWKMEQTTLDIQRFFILDFGYKNARAFVLYFGIVVACYSCKNALFNSK
jgi:hypothetical protein